MSDLCLFYPDGHAAHYQSGHPERPGRVEAIHDIFVKADIWDNYPILNPESIPLDVLHNIHDPHHLEKLRSASQEGNPLDTDTYLTPASWQLALNSAGGAIAVAKSVWRQEHKRGFALTRPPGHHATSNRSMGFCLLNNIAIASEYLLQHENADRLAIIDIDLHHGNGTQDIFYSRDDVLFISIHQSPLYPGTGSIPETGSSTGEWANLNIPLPPYSGDTAFLACLHSVTIPMLDRFNPNMLLVSAGFDAHWRDPLGNLLVSTDCIAQVISGLTHWADRNCDGRIALFLEGGYDLEAGADSALAAAQALLGNPWIDPLGQSQTEESSNWEIVIDQVKNKWEILP